MKKTVFYVLMIAFIFLLPFSSFGYWAVVGFQNPLMLLNVEEKYKTLPTDVLIQKMESFDFFDPRPSLAIRVASIRKAKEAVPELVRIAQYSWNPDRKAAAIRALGKIGDDRAASVLMKILNESNNKNNPYYHEALYSLCEIGYQPVRPIVLKMLEQPDGARNGATSMIGFLGKKEDLKILENMLSNIKGDDVNAKLDRDSVTKAIEAIKRRETI